MACTMKFENSASGEKCFGLPGFACCKSLNGYEVRRTQLWRPWGRSDEVRWDRTVSEEDEQRNVSWRQYKQYGRYTWKPRDACREEVKPLPTCERTVMAKDGVMAPPSHCPWAICPVSQESRTSPRQTNLGLYSRTLAHSYRLADKARRVGRCSVKVDSTKAHPRNSRHPGWTTILDLSSRSCGLRLQPTCRGSGASRAETVGMLMRGA